MAMKYRMGERTGGETATQLLHRLTSYEPGSTVRCRRCLASRSTRCCSPAWACQTTYPQPPGHPARRTGCAGLPGVFDL